MLAGVDAMVFDVQDVGSRYYTFVYTMLHVMEACAREKKRVVVLDRPNPLGRRRRRRQRARPRVPLLRRDAPARGAPRDDERASSRCCSARSSALDVDLHVVPMKGWRRPMHYEDTGLPWVLPSPNIPTVDTAFVYPGGCLVEGTNLSEGRGTTRPVRARGRALARRPRPRARARARAHPGRRLPRRRVHARPSRSTRASCATACRSTSPTARASPPSSRTCC